MLLCFALICKGGADAASDGGGKVNVSCLNFRSEPNTSSTVLSLAYEGETVIITGHEGDWYSVIFNGVEGYMFAEYVTPVETLEIIPVSAKVNANSVRFRDGASYESKAVYYLNTGAPLKVLGVSGCWYKVK